MKPYPFPKVSTPPFEFPEITTDSPYCHLLGTPQAHAAWDAWRNDNPLRARVFVGVEALDRGSLPELLADEYAEVDYLCDYHAANPHGEGCETRNRLSCWTWWPWPEDIDLKTKWQLTRDFYYFWWHFVETASRS
jgi:hypothetical protein